MFKNFIYYSVLLLFSINLFLYCDETNGSLKDKMDNYEEKVKTKWEYNPFKNYATDRYFSSWLNPNAYNSKFWFGDIFNIKEMYPNKNFNFDKMILYYIIIRL